MTHCKTAWPGHKHPDDVDWRQVDFTAPLAGDTITSVVKAIGVGVEVLDYEYTPTAVRVRLSGGEPSSIRPAVVQIVVETSTPGRTIAGDVELTICR